MRHSHTALTDTGNEVRLAVVICCWQLMSSLFAGCTGCCEQLVVSAAIRPSAGVASCEFRAHFCYDLGQPGAQATGGQLLLERMVFT